MMIHQPATLLLAFGTFSPLAVQTAGPAHNVAHAAPEHTAATSSKADSSEVAIVSVKAPWYAFNFLLSTGFKKALPTYQQVPGLRFKAFSSSVTPDGKVFGGIYWWDSETQARNWYTPQWAAEVMRNRGHQPKVAYYPVVQEAVFVGPEFDYRQYEKHCIILFVHALSPELRRQCLAAQPGLLRACVVREPRAANQQGALLLFASARQAKSFLRQQPAATYDWFWTPVLLSNALGNRS